MIFSQQVSGGRPMAADLSHFTKSWSKNNFLTGSYSLLDTQWAGAWFYECAGLAPGLIEIYYEWNWYDNHRIFLGNILKTTHRKSKLTSRFLRRFTQWFSLYLHLLSYVVKKVASQSFIFQNINFFSSSWHKIWWMCYALMICLLTQRARLSGPLIP